MLPSGLQIEIEDRGPTTVVTAAGEVDLVTSIELKRAFDALLDREAAPARITADFRQVHFMDTSGVAMLLAIRARALALGSRLVVTSASPSLQRLFDVTGLAEFLTE